MVSWLWYVWVMCEWLFKMVEVFSVGDIGYLMFVMIVYCIDLIVDFDVLVVVDV